MNVLALRRAARRDIDTGTGVLIAVGLGLLILCRRFPAEMPVFAPWDFSLFEFLCTVLPFFWYVRGLAATPAPLRPHIARQVAFVLGVGMIYAVLQTHFVYMSQHMFFLNRAQHLVMHHLGPFLVALAWPGPTIARGMPAALLARLRGRAVQRVLAVVQHPVVAGTLFVGLIALWLEPTVHFYAMVSPLSYDVMNSSMVLDGLLFWFFALDPRPAPLSRSSYATRLITVILVMFPQIIMGASITFSTTALYAYYDLCGRLFPSIGALYDQHLGGLLVWIPSSMMSSAAFMLIMNNIRVQEDRACEGNSRNDIVLPNGVAISSGSWTGR